MMRQVVLYGDVNLNIIDGSAIWLVSLAETLARTDSHIHVQLKAPVKTDRLLTRLRSLDNVTIHDPDLRAGLEAIAAKAAPAVLGGLAHRVGADIVVVRGTDVNRAAVEEPSLDGKLWAYVTDYDIPLTAQKRDAIDAIGAGAHRFFAQTAAARAYLEANIPSLAGKTLLMNPIVPDDFFVPLQPRTAGEELRLVYSGKFHPDWCTDKMTELPSMLSAAGIPTHLEMVGDKVQPRRGEAEWAKVMQDLLDNPPPGVHPAGGMPREGALAVVAGCDIGLGFRTGALDASLEISTKMLEYAASGTPPLVNRTAAHEELFGVDYPLFTSSDDLDEIVSIIRDALPDLPRIASEAQKAVHWYSGQETAARLEGMFQRSEADYGFIPLTERRRILVASHDFKFAGDIIEALRLRDDVAMTIDQWETLHKHDEAESQRLLDDADVIFCEWAGKNAVWYSQHKRPDQRLIVRLHGFEIRNNAPWLPDIDIEQVDAVVTVAAHMKDLVIERAGWPAEKVVVVPNSLDAVDLDRPKLPGAQHRMGIVGVVPSLKRFDRALDLLELLIEGDDRYTLHVKGRMPWEYPHHWKNPEEREFYLSQFNRFTTNPRLAEHVVFESFSPDVANWLTKIGWVLSPSEHESFHLAPAEGMASGAVPVLWERDGVSDIFGSENVVQDAGEAANLIRRLQPEWSAASDQMRRVAMERFDTRVTNASLIRLLLEG